MKSKVAANTSIPKECNVDDDDNDDGDDDANNYNLSQ